MSDLKSKNPLDRRSAIFGLWQLKSLPAPLIPLLHHTYERLFQPYVRGIEVNGLGDPYLDLRKIWLDRPR